MPPATYRPLALLVLPLALACSSGPQASPARRAEVAARGATVMPFDLQRTRHRFEPLADGGLQTVTANDPGDTAEVRLVREHLDAEAARFSRGDFADPRAIHGHGMPGVAELSAGAARIQIGFAAIDGGARIRYTSTDAALVAALHRWFEAQRMDHGVPE